MPARERECRSRAGDAPLTLSILLSLRVRAPRMRPPRPASPSPPGNESLLNGTSTARTPTGAPDRPDSRGRGERTPGPPTPQAQRSHERIQGQTSGGQLPAAKFRGPSSGGRFLGKTLALNPGWKPSGVRGPGAGANFRGRGAGRRWSSSGRRTKKPIAAATFDTHGCVGGFQCGCCVVA